MMYKDGISVCMIVKNEERFIKDFLDSIISYVDEICIADTGSTDNTLSIITEYPDAYKKIKLQLIPWNDHFGEAKNHALKMASYDKIIVLDADERLDKPELLSKVFNNLPKNKLGLVKFINYSELKIQNTQSGYYEHYNAKLFWNGQNTKYYGRIHEYLIFNGLPIQEVSLMIINTYLVINHYGYSKEMMMIRDKYHRNMKLLLMFAEEEPLNAYNWYNLGLTQICDTSQGENIPNINPYYDLNKGIESLSKSLDLIKDKKVSYKGHLEEYLQRAKDVKNMYGTQTWYEYKNNKKEKVLVET